MADRPTFVPGMMPRAIRILSPKVARPITSLFLGPCYGLMLHWSAKGPKLCRGEGQCPASLHKDTVYWKGFWPAEQWDSVNEAWIPSVLETTEHAEHPLQGRPVRGELWLWTIDGPKANSPMIGRFLERFGESDLSPVFDVRPILIRFFHCIDLPASVANPIPPPTVATPRTGRPPSLHVHQQTASDPGEPMNRTTFEELRKKLAGEVGRPNGRAPK